MRHPLEDEKPVLTKSGSVEPSQSLSTLSQTSVAAGLMLLLPSLQSPAFETVPAGWEQSLWLDEALP
jgi:hypothetical protein